MKTKKTLRLLIAAALLCVLLGGCAKGETAEAYPKYAPIEAAGDGMVTIPVEGITTDARFFNYDADGVTVQLVALRDPDDGVHVAFNTCQNCSPSPKAYYTQEGDVLRCTNCDFTFAPEEVGVTHGGCNPWPIDGVRIGAEEITLPGSSLEAMRSVFQAWEGPAE